MKETQLSDLLKQITPLPWHMDESGDVRANETRRLSKICLTGFSLAGGHNYQADANNAYVHHAANVLPEVLKACETVFNRVVEIAEMPREEKRRRLATPSDIRSLVDELEQAIDLAQTIKEK